MGMTSSAVGIREKNELYFKMVDAYKALKKAGLPISKELDDYFQEDFPDGALSIPIKTNEWSDGDMGEGIEVNLSDIPKDVEIIRFINSY
jgi:hypothetical protein